LLPGASAFVPLDVAGEIAACAAVPAANMRRTAQTTSERMLQSCRTGKSNFFKWRS
jgi:hypothetical protein